MPSPVFHVFAGVSIAGAVSGGWRSVRFKTLVASLFFSMLPDADVAVGLAAGDVATYHNNLSHSPFFALMICTLLWLLARRVLPELSRGRLALLTYGGCGLHVALDSMTYGRGIMLAWPFSGERFRAPVEVFRGVRWSEGLWARPHLETLSNELAVIAIVVAVYIVGRCLRRAAA